MRLYAFPAIFGSRKDWRRFTFHAADSWPKENRFARGQLGASQLIGSNLPAVTLSSGSTLEAN